MTRGPIPRPAERVVMEGGRINRYDPLEWELLHDPIWQGILAPGQAIIDKIERLTHAPTLPVPGLPTD